VVFPSFLSLIIPRRTIGSRSIPDPHSGGNRFKKKRKGRGVLRKGNQEIRSLGELCVFFGPRAKFRVLLREGAPCSAVKKANAFALAGRAHIKKAGKNLTTTNRRFADTNQTNRYVDRVYIAEIRHRFLPFVFVCGVRGLFSQKLCGF
jgi:hypothetical protein